MPEEELPDDAPDELVLMRAVAEGRVPGDARGRAYKHLLDKKPMQFVEKMTDLAAKYWAAKGPASQATVWDGRGACPTCKRGPGAVVVEESEDEGTKRAIGVLERILKGAGKS